MVCAHAIRRCLLLAFIVVLVPAVASAAGRKPAKAAPAGETVEMFRAIESGQISVRMIPKDATEATLFITNKTKQPLGVQLPAAFAGVPVLAQLGLPPFGPQPGFQQQQQQTGQNASQQMALLPDPFAALQQRGPGRGQFNFRQNRRGFFNIPPEGVGKIKLVGLCLDHGKPNPRAAIPYEVRPLESVTADPTVKELCEMLGRQEITRQVAQLGAWHLVDGLSWQNLAAERDPGFLGGTPRYLRTDIEAARKAVAKAAESVKGHGAPSDVVSSSR
jgi:hypothetical protein